MRLSALLKFGDFFVAPCYSAFKIRNALGQKVASNNEPAAAKDNRECGKCRWICEHEGRVRLQKINQVLHGATIAESRLGAKARQIDPDLNVQVLSGSERATLP